MASFFDDEIGSWSCLGTAWRCTPSEAIGIWSVILFYTTIFVATITHSVMQSNVGAERNDAATRRHIMAGDSGDDWLMLCSFLLYFFGLAAGCLVWALGGLAWVHPVQIWWVQLLGAVMLAACGYLFVAAHVDMGENWSPEPEQLTRHQLVTHGVFRWVRHPMYAAFLWASIGTFLATLNWVVAWCVFGVNLIMFSRIPTEERILVEISAGRYLQYRREVSALGPPWSCLGFDREMPEAINSQYRDVYSRVR